MTPTTKRRRQQKGPRIAGTVKWYNVKAAYGFITRDDTGDEVFVHRSAIVRYHSRKAIPSVGDGEAVEFFVISTKKGDRATYVSAPNWTRVNGSPYAPDRRRRRRRRPTVPRQPAEMSPVVQQQVVDPPLRVGDQLRLCLEPSANSVNSENVKSVHKNSVTVNNVRNVKSATTNSARNVNSTSDSVSDIDSDNVRSCRFGAPVVPVVLASARAPALSRPTTAPARLAALTPARTTRAAR